ICLRPVVAKELRKLIVTTLERILMDSASCPVDVVAIDAFDEDVKAELFIGKAVGQPCHEIRIGTSENHTVFCRDVPVAVNILDHALSCVRIDADFAESKECSKRFAYACDVNPGRTERIAKSNGIDIAATCQTCDDILILRKLAGDIPLEILTPSDVGIRCQLYPGVVYFTNVLEY